MVLSINWVTKVISVPKADLTPVQPDPEIKELNINNFHGWLRALEDDEEGMPFLPTHNHVAPISIGDLTLARVIEMINGYTVTFEAGQYAVNIKGGNSNIAEVTNVNQVSIRPFNSAGLVTSAGIEALEYERGVWINSASSNTGTLYPTGTLRRPVNNLADAKLIASVRGFDTLFILGDFTFGATDDISGFYICGGDQISSVITLTSGCITTGTRFEHTTLQGTANGKVLVSNCFILSLAGVQGTIKHCALMETMTLAGSITTHVIDCYDGLEGFGEPIIDFGGSGRGLNVRGFQGGLRLENKSGSEDASIGLNGGRLELASDITDGEFVIRGVGEISDNSSTGTAVIKDDGLVNMHLLTHKFTIDEANSKLQMWDIAGTTVVKEWPLTDKDLQTIVLQGTGPANRGVPTSWP